MIWVVVACANDEAFRDVIEEFWRMAAWLLAWPGLRSRFEIRTPRLVAGGPVQDMNL